MAWDASKPIDSGLLINAPGQIRANWDALALLTDSALSITNAKVKSDAAIAESKITFSGTGHGHTGTTDGNIIDLTSAVTGVLPLANGGTEFVSSDLMLSANTSPSTGWTDVSSTYDDKYIRVDSGTPLGTGGNATHTHTGPSHTHTFTTGNPYVGGGGWAASGADNTHLHDGTSASSGTGATGAANTDPVYVNVRMFQKD